MSKIVIRFNATSNDAIDVAETYEEVKAKLASAKNGCFEVTRTENGAPLTINVAYFVQIDGPAPVRPYEGLEHRENHEPQTSLDVSQTAPLSPEALAVTAKDNA